MDINFTHISIILLLVIGVITFIVRYKIAKKKNINMTNTELVVTVLQPIILEVLNDIIRFDYQVKDKTSFYEFWVQYIITKLQEMNIDEQLITVDNIKLVAEPILDQVWYMGRKE